MNKIEWPSGEKIRVQTVGVRTASGPKVHRELVEEAHKEYVQIFGNIQSLEKIQERGGFDIVELATYLYLRIKRLETEG